MELHHLGEASAQLSAQLKEQFADVAWRQPARLRNRIVHGYWSIDLDIVHTTAQEQLPVGQPPGRGAVNQARLWRKLARGFLRGGVSVNQR